MDLSQRPAYSPSTELQRRAVEARRNIKRLARYRNIRQYLIAVRIVEALNRGHR
jgi:hypothetical protein